jgi:hypothetical protein
MAAALLCKIGIHTDLDIEQCLIFYDSDDVPLGYTLEALGMDDGARVAVAVHGGTTGIRPLVDAVQALHSATTIDSMAAALEQAAQMGDSGLERMMDAVARTRSSLEDEAAMAAVKATHANAQQRLRAGEEELRVCQEQVQRLRQEAAEAQQAMAQAEAALAAHTESNGLNSTLLNDLKRVRSTAGI